MYFFRGAKVRFFFLIYNTCLCFYQETLLSDSAARKWRA